MAMLIKKRRQAAGLSKAQVARLMQVNQSQVSRWETGEHTPTADRLPQLAAMFHCTIDDLFAKDTAADAAS